MQEIDTANLTISRAITDCINLVRKRDKNQGIVEFAGFNGSYFVIDPEKKTIDKKAGCIQVTAQLKCSWVNYSIFEKYGVRDLLSEYFSDCSRNISLQYDDINTDTDINDGKNYNLKAVFSFDYIRVNETRPLPSDEDFEKILPVINKLTYIDSLVQSSVLIKCLRDLMAGTKIAPVSYCLNDPRTTEFARYVFIKQSVDGNVLNVAFSTAAMDDDNRILTKVFLTEINDFSRTNTRANRPGFKFTAKLLDEMNNEPIFAENIKNSANLKEKFTGFVTVSLNKSMNVSQDEKQTATTVIFTMQTIEYHLKATKSWLQNRMRQDTQKWLFELNH